MHAVSESIQKLLAIGTCKVSLNEMSNVVTNYPTNLSAVEFITLMPSPPKQVSTNDIEQGPQVSPSETCVA